MYYNISNVINMYRTFMVTKQGCPFCIKAKKTLIDKNIEFKEFDYLEYSRLSNEITNSYGHKTYPKIFINGKFVGGFSDLEEKFENLTSRDINSDDKKNINNEKESSTLEEDDEESDKVGDHQNDNSKINHEKECCNEIETERNMAEHPKNIENPIKYSFWYKVFHFWKFIKLYF